MSQNDWNEQKIEQLLSQMPKPHDTRSKEDVFKRLQQDLEPSKKPEKKRKYWAPPAVGIAAMITLTLLGVTYINNSSHDEMAVQGDVQDHASKYAEKSMDTSSTLKTSPKEAESSELTSDKLSNETVTYAKSIDIKTAVYQEDAQNYTIFQIGLAGNQANSVPVTYLIPNEIIQNDFEGATPTQLDLYQKYASQIDEEALGFSEYHPYKGTFKTDGESLIHVLPKNHNYDLASAGSILYISSLRDTFDQYKEIRFQNEDGSVAEFDQIGELSKPIRLKNNQWMQNYYLFTATNGREFLTPNFGQSYSNITEALESMKDAPNDVYTSVVPSGIDYEVIEEADLVRIIFTKELDLDTLELKEAMNLIEGILLTGASFQQSISMDNVVQSNWNGFDFTKPLPIPIGPNKMYYESIQ